MAFNIQYKFTAINAFTATAAKINTAMKKQAEKVKQLNKQFKETGKAMQDIGKKGITRITAPIVAVSGFALKASADLETLNTSFVSMLGNEEKAAQMTRDLINFTAKTPFQLDGVGKSAKQLLAFGVAQKDIQPTLQTLGDISAGANVPLTDMAAIFGKVKAKGKAMTEELLQLSDRGVPIIDTLSAGLGVSKTKVFELATQGKISFDIMTKAMQHMTSEGQIFHGQMKRQSETMHGIWSTLKDNLNIVLATIGDQLQETFDIKGIMSAVIVKLQKLNAWFTGLSPSTRKWLTIMVGIAAILPPIIFALGGMLIAIGSMTLMAPALAAGLGAIGTVFAILTGPVGLAIALFSAFAFIGKTLYDEWEPFRNLVNEIAVFLDAMLIVAIEKTTNLIETMVTKIKGLVLGVGALLSGDFETAMKGAAQFLTGKAILGDQAGMSEEERMKAIGGFRGGSVVNPEALANQKSQIDLNIKIDDETGKVKETKTRQRGPANLRTGSNSG